MSICDKNYFELCNEILSELYFEEVSTFDELEDIAEGRRVKKELNRALTFICNKEETDWEFRDVEEFLIPTVNISHYNKPNGFIKYIKYPKSNLVLQYYDDHKYCVDYNIGRPVGYWIDGDKIRLYPIPDSTYNDDPLEIHYYTYNFAKDCCGIGKPVMVYETDTPIIPNNHRDILIWKVCMDWRANLNDPKTQYYQQQFKTAYRNMLADCRFTEDLPNGLHLGPTYTSYKHQLLDILNNPYTSNTGYGDKTDGR